VLFDPWLDQGYCHFLHVSWESQNCDSVQDPGRDNEWGGEYGPYLFEDFFDGDAQGGTLYFTMSTWNPYTVVLMQADVEFSSPTLAPELSVRIVDGNLLIRWPCQFQNHVLMSTPVLGETEAWTPVAGSIQIVDGMNEVTTSLPHGQAYFRLERP
jgi:hypothetical protein